MGEIESASLIFDCVRRNLHIISKQKVLFKPQTIKYFGSYLAYALPNKHELLEGDDVRWEFINSLMDELAADRRFRDIPYVCGAVFIEGYSTLAFDDLLVHILKSHEHGDIKLANLVAAVLTNRYGFRRRKFNEEPTNSSKKPEHFFKYEALKLYRIWEDCSGIDGEVLVEFGETEKDDKKRPLTEHEIAYRKAQKIRRNFQVLEQLKSKDSLHVARRLYRTNGIANFNRYDLETLSNQYDIQTRSYMGTKPAKTSILTVLPYSDSNGALEEHYIINNSNHPVEETIIESDTIKTAAIHILRATKGTAYRQRHNRDLYPVPYNYVYVAAHSNRKGIHIGDRNTSGFLHSNTIDIPIVTNPNFYMWLMRHRLIDNATIILLGGCKTAEDDDEDHTSKNIAQTLKEVLHVEDVIASRTYTYSDQVPLIKRDGTITLRQTGNRRKAQIVSIAQEYPNYTYNQ